MKDRLVSFALATGLILGVVELVFFVAAILGKTRLGQ